MKIGKRPGGAPPPTANDHPEPMPGEWFVRVSTSVAVNVPAEILRKWIIVETFARDKAECWPGNKALAAGFGVKTRAVQLAIQTLEDHGIAERRPMPGNRRGIFLIRRTSQPMTAIEWKTLAERAVRRADGRVNTAKVKAAARRKYKPPTKVVS